MTGVGGREGRVRWASGAWHKNVCMTSEPDTIRDEFRQWDKAVSRDGTEGEGRRYGPGGGMVQRGSRDGTGGGRGWDRGVGGKNNEK